MINTDDVKMDPGGKRKRSYDERDPLLVPATQQSSFLGSIGSGLYSAASSMVTYAVYPVVYVGQALSSFSSVTIQGLGGAISYTLPAACAMLEAGPSLRELGLSDGIVDATASGTLTLANRVAAAIDDKTPGTNHSDKSSTVKATSPKNTDETCSTGDVMESGVLSGILETVWMMGAHYMTDIPSHEELSKEAYENALQLQNHCESVWTKDPTLNPAVSGGALSSHEPSNHQDTLIDQTVAAGASLLTAGRNLSDHIMRVKNIFWSLSRKKNAAELRLAGSIVRFAGSNMSDRDSELVADHFLDAAINSACQSVSVQQRQEGGWAADLVGGFLVMLQKTKLHKLPGNLIRTRLAKIVQSSHNRTNEEYIKRTLVQSLEVGGMRVVGYTVNSCVDALQSGVLIPTDLVTCTQMETMVGAMEGMLSNMEHFADLVTYQACAVSLVGELMEVVYSMRTLSRDIARGVSHPNPSRRSLNHILLASATSDTDAALTKLGSYTPGGRPLLRQLVAAWQLQLVLGKYTAETSLGRSVDNVLASLQEFWDQPSGEFGERFNKAAQAAQLSSAKGGYEVNHSDLKEGAGNLTKEVLHVKLKNKVLGSIVPVCLAGGQAYCGNVWGALWTTASGMAAPLAATALAPAAAAQVSKVDWDQKLGTSLHIAIRMLSTFCENFYLGLSEQEKQQIELRLTSSDPSVLLQPIPIECSASSSVTSPSSRYQSSSADSGVSSHITTTLPEETNQSSPIVLPLVTDVDAPDQLSPQSSAPQPSGLSLSPSLHPDPSPRSVTRLLPPPAPSQLKVVEILKPSPQPSPTSFRTQKISPEPKISPPASPQVTSAPTLASPTLPARKYHRTDSMHHSPTYQSPDVVVNMPTGRDSSNSSGSNNSVSSTSTLMNENAKKPASRCPCWGKRQKKG